MYTWNQNSDLSANPIVTLQVLKVDLTIFITCSKVEHIVAFESRHRLTQVGDKCLARHGELRRWFKLCCARSVSLHRSDVRSVVFDSNKPKRRKEG